MVAPSFSAQPPVARDRDFGALPNDRGYPAVTQGRDRDYNMHSAPLAGPRGDFREPDLRHGGPPPTRDYREPDMRPRDDLSARDRYPPPLGIQQQPPPPQQQQQQQLQQQPPPSSSLALSLDQLTSKLRQAIASTQGLGGVLRCVKLQGVMIALTYMICCSDLPPVSQAPFDRYADQYAPAEPRYTQQGLPAQDYAYPPQPRAQEYQQPPYPGNSYQAAQQPPYDPRAPSFPNQG